ncbi:hypothetical protein GHK86_12995 [Acidimicrobiaceae bacterium USS-CC1]|uniref:Uncharacterized protein n=1 Tax=Acidiferrimicrobium australe TaxID=2664430 RepID=A0ABW9QVG0_9ACTN|nr:hypothetical protein [Acidiferrimicrobium australe]
MASPVPPASARPRPARFFFPRSHRLYARFEDRAAADAAVGALAEAGFAVSGAWTFEGPSGASELDPGEITGLARLLSWWMSHNVEFLRGFGRAVREGQVVVALPAARLGTADEMAPVLRAGGGQRLVYTAHGNFVPVTPPS